jgi:recombinational DNA repair protein (RecF pathway)
MKCDRCQQPMTVFTTSFFNTEEICMNCVKREQAHPQYAEAKRVEEEACRNRNFNFEGIGCPPELYEPET